MKKIFLVAIPIAISQMGATDCGQIIKDPGFDLWCGDHLCDWKVERGATSRVPTWHTGDDGVSLDGNDVLVTQLTPVTSSDSTCIEFSMLTNIDLDTDVRLQFDVFGDGSVDYEQQIPAANWAPVSYLVSIQAPWNGIKFRLAKTGAGSAVLAEIKAQTRPAADCNGLAPVVLGARPDGGWCGAGTDCVSGVCVYGAVPPGGIFAPLVCAACTTDSQCANGAVCGIDDALPSELTPFRACIPPGSRRLGELCAENAECATGICHETCSTCKDSTSCATGETCAAASQSFPAPDGSTYQSAATYECDPGQHERASGEPCFRDDDCASSHCNGPALDTCIDTIRGGDGRTCANELDCPETNQLDHTPCVAVGIAGGTCQ